MNGLEITVVLGAAVLAGTVLATRLRVPTPLLLLTLGLLLGLVPELREVELPPDVVLLLFLPVMLFWESLTTSLRAIRRAFRGIVIMSTLMVVATALGVAALAHWMGMPWDAALVLGAAVAPPDATAVAALGRTLPRRHFMILKAESLTNDGTALVVYAVAVGLASGGHYSTLDVTEVVLRSYLGGLLAGAIVAAAGYAIMRSVRDTLSLNLTLLLVPFAAYLLAETFHASGVLAVVVAGLTIAYVSSRISTPASRRQTEWTWPLGSYVLNSALFVLVGLEVQVVVHDAEMDHVARLLATIVVVWAGMLVIRFGFQTLTIMIIRVLDRRPSQRLRRTTFRGRVVTAVAGFRGAVSLAIALSVPATLDDGTPFPGREDIVIMTAGVILLTLLVQGPLLPVVVRWARLPEDTSPAEERRLAERALSEAAGDALEGLVEELGTSPATHERVKREHADHLASVDTLDPDADHALFGEPDDYARLRLALIERKRDALWQLRAEGTVDDEVVREIRTRLDIEELRLTGIEPLE
ncbi:Na+/H+ antiporter [Aeromicrobium sp. IC_218]|uniref:Na+/H+ antiporter n=1 Tax=Aeromicrobium sp. IC_218 TaxID=2545468 RepID=UPI00103D0857|nr:Na+/H+ antiporter [Aeromicrobium sp. IC_218]TCJ00769.1 Na+/H+ antiporter [Aeromicrobium sp. IC_218]